MTVIDKPEFRNMLLTFDSKFTLPGSAKVKKLLIEKWYMGVTEMKAIIKKATRITICLDEYGRRKVCHTHF